MKCPNCNGRGSIPMLTSAKPCAKCGATGVLFPYDGKHRNDFIDFLNARGDGPRLVDGTFTIQSWDEAAADIQPDDSVIRMSADNKPEWYSPSTGKTGPVYPIPWGTRDDVKLVGKPNSNPRQIS